MKRENSSPLDEESEASASEAKKQILLRLSPALWRKLQSWAEDDFRSINGQIEYLLNESVKHREKR